MHEAKQRLEQILLLWPDNGLALVHYGFVLKLDGALIAAVQYLSKGIQSNENGTQEGRFYFHLGDALQRLGKNGEAMEVDAHNRKFSSIVFVRILSNRTVCR